jgi:hypothetical protein
LALFLFPFPSEKKAKKIETQIAQEGLRLPFPLARRFGDSHEFVFRERHYSTEAR